MKRFAAIFLSILLGAAVVAIGMGIFLYKANVDRKQLATIAQTATEQAKQAAAERERAIHEANAELDTAKHEITKAQATVAALKEEREALAQATTLEAPSSKTLRGWTHAVSLPLKISLSLPPKHEIKENSEARFLSAFDLRYLTPSSSAILVIPYSEAEEQTLLRSIQNGTAISYAVQGHLLRGIRGENVDAPGTTGIVVAIQLYNQKTHLVRISEPKGTQGVEIVRTILSSIDIAP
jgi:hypothetical protein